MVFRTNCRSEGLEIQFFEDIVAQGLRDSFAVKFWAGGSERQFLAEIVPQGDMRASCSKKLSRRRF